MQFRKHNATNATQQLQRGKCNAESKCNTSNIRKRTQNINAQMLHALCIYAHIKHNNGCGPRCPCQLSATHQPLMRCWRECHLTSSLHLRNLMFWMPCSRYHIMRDAWVRQSQCLQNAANEHSLRQDNSPQLIHANARFPRRMPLQKATTSKWWLMVEGSGTYSV